MRNKLLAFALAVIAANPAAALTPEADLPKYSDPSGDARGRGAAVYENGDVLFLVQSYGTPSGPVLVRMDPTMTILRWRKPLAGYNGMQGFCLAVSGETAYVGGSDIGNTVGRVVAVNGSGDPTGVHSDFGVSAGFRSIAVDPVDGSIWAVGVTGSAPTKARVAHLGAGLGPIAVDDYLAPPGTDAQARSVAVTAERVYVGGSAYDVTIGLTRAWLMARSRLAPDLLWHKWASTLGGGTVVSGLSAVGDDVYSFVGSEVSLIQSSWIFKNDPATGAFGGQTSVITNAPMTGTGEFAGSVVRHPSLPVVIASTSNGFRCFKPDLTEIAGGMGLFNSLGQFTPAWVAVSNRLEFSVYGAYSANQAAIWRAFGAGVRMTSPFEAVKTASNLLVAPNRLDLSRSGAQIRFAVRVATLPAEGTIRIYDLAGRPVAALPFTAEFGATADVLWDGRREDGDRVGPGGYLAVVDGTGFKPRADRMPFVVTGGAQ